MTPRPRIAALAAVLAAQIALIAGAEAQSAAPAPRTPTIGELAGQPARPVQTAPQPGAALPSLTGNMPSIGDIAAKPDRLPRNAGCKPPTLPTRLPEGAKATEAEMKTARAEFQAFVTGGQDFIACLDEGYRANASTITVGTYMSMLTAHNEMVNAMQLLAERFNQELRAYKAKQPPQN